MRNNKVTLQQKLWIIVFVILFLSLAFSFILSQIFYERMYVDYVRANLSHLSEKVAEDYTGGGISDEFKERTEWLNTKMTGKLFVVNSPKELSTCLPFDIDYDSLISGEDRQQLLRGELVYKKEFVERFDREIIAVIYPLSHEGNLEGIIYTYTPIQPFVEFGKLFTNRWVLTASLFMVIMFYVGARVVNKTIQPIKEIEVAAIKVSKGDFSTVLYDESSDEIGRLSAAFNKMSRAMQGEDERRRGFLGDVSHELRTPLSYIKGYTQLLLDDIVEDKEEQKKYLSLIARESNRLQGIVEDLIDLTKLEENVCKLELVPLPLSQCIEDTLQKYEPILQEQHLKLEMDLDSDVIILGDEGRINQIICNIVKNAICYSREGGTINIELLSENGQCQLNIRDNGIGMSAEDVAKVTERFYRVNKARSRFDGGTGIGLSIVNKLMQLHNGKLLIESRLNDGTNVKLIFPLVEDDTLF